MGGSLPPCVFGSVTRIPRPWVVVNILPETPVLLLAGKGNAGVPQAGAAAAKARFPLVRGKCSSEQHKQLLLRWPVPGIAGLSIVGLVVGLGRGVDGRKGRPRFAAAVAAAFKGCFEVKTVHKATGSHQDVCGCGCVGCEWRGDMGYGQLWAMGYGLWAMRYGLWAMGYGLWAMGYGLWAMGYGAMGYGPIAYGLWFPPTP